MDFLIKNNTKEKAPTGLCKKKKKKSARYLLICWQSFNTAFKPHFQHVLEHFNKGQFFPIYIQKRNEITILKRYLYSHVRYNIIHSSQDMNTNIHCRINGWRRENQVWSCDSGWIFSGKITEKWKPQRVVLKLICKPLTILDWLLNCAYAGQNFREASGK